NSVCYEFSQLAQSDYIINTNDILQIEVSVQLPFKFGQVQVSTQLINLIQVQSPMRSQPGKNVIVELVFAAQLFSFVKSLTFKDFFDICMIIRNIPSTLQAIIRVSRRTHTQI